MNLCYAIRVTADAVPAAVLVMTSSDCSRSAQLTLSLPLSLPEF